MSSGVQISPWKFPFLCHLLIPQPVLSPAEDMDVMVVPDWSGTATLEVLFAPCCGCLHAFRMLAGRPEAVLAAYTTSPWKDHILGVSICKCRSCCRGEFQALSFAAVCAAAKEGRMCFSPSLSLSLWSERETFLISNSDLHDSSL